MKAAVYTSNSTRGVVSGHMIAMSAGLVRHGVDVSYFHGVPDLAADFAVCWGWRKGMRIRAGGFTKPILVMERGYFPDRFEWTSLGWDGLNGRARWNGAHDRGERFWRNFGHLACEWERYNGYTLIIGQVEGDAALHGVDFARWVRETMDEADRLGQLVYFRAHPEAVRRNQIIPVTRDFILGGTLQEAFSGAGRVVTFNSNTGVEAVLAGIPTVTMDEGAMAWPVTSHSLHAPLVMPDRSEWFRDMAWRQWSMDEIASGFAWEIVREAM